MTDLAASDGRGVTRVFTALAFSHVLLLERYGLRTNSLVLHGETNVIVLLVMASVHAAFASESVH